VQFGKDVDISAVSKMGIILLHLANGSLSGRMGRQEAPGSLSLSLWRPIWGMYVNPILNHPARSQLSITSKVLHA